MKNYFYTIGNRTRDLPACSAEPQQTVPISTHTVEKSHKINGVRRAKSAHTIPKYDANGLSSGFHIIGIE